MRMIRSILLLAGVLCSVPAMVSAQPAPDSPMFLMPGPSPALGVYLVDTYHAGLGGVVTYRNSTWPFGLRFGLAEDADDLGVLGGIDFGGGVHRETRDVPLNIDWFAGAGIGVGTNVLLSFPLGLTGAHTFLSQGAAFTPFLAPRLVLDVLFIDEPAVGQDDTDVDLDLAADLGVDVRLSGFRPGIRFAFSLGRDALGIGLVFGPSRVLSLR